jgi:Transposase DDE domain group 1
MIECRLVSHERQTAFGGLCALGHFLAQEGALEPLSGVHIDQKTVKHSPAQKLADALVGMLAGCKAIYETNARVRPDVPLSRAFGRERVAEQSTIQRTLDAFSEENVCELREAVERIGGRYSGLPQHPYDQQMLVVEVDLTGLRASKRAELSTKGYFSGERNATGRQLVRASAPLYEEVIFSKLHAGNTTSCEVLKQTMAEVERLLKSSPKKRSRTLIRLDGGFGTDENVEWLCTSGYQFVVKGYGGGRASKLARSVAEDGWHEGPTAGQFLGVPTQEEAPRYSRQTKTVLRRWKDAKGKLYTDYLLSTLTDLSAEQIAKLYDGRGGMEVDIKGDKRGLGIENRRKKGFFAQEAVALLAQLSHNLLAYFKGWLLGGTDAAKLGVERLVREVLAMPAEARMGRRRGAKLLLKLPKLHPWAEALALGTQARFPPSGWRTIWRKN